MNLLVRRIAPLDAPDLLSRRPHAQVKDFSMLDARELARIALEQPRVAAASAGGATAARRSAPRPPAHQAAPTPSGSAPTASDPPAREAAEPDEPLPASGTGAEDFRAVAPPIMNFAQGRRR